ncbi:MAG: hypothetical protein GDA51_07745 [Ekhidna sp.]|nr:hypothetical protein [Ekhidna sp.]MBC6426346.1 hypothetical protein [Ekhidna sp.]
MEMVYDLLKMTIPAVLMLYLSYLLVRSFLRKQLDEITFSARRKNQEVVVPIRLQAYERVTLLLERITPPNLLSRLGNADYNAEEFQQILVHEIRNEFNHNLSQQVYMSDSAWTYVTTAVEQTISLINSSANMLDKEARGVELARAILEKGVGEEMDMPKQAIRYIKEEIQDVF